MTPQPLAAKVDELLDSMEGRNPLEIHALIHERRRKRAHVKAKVTQPNLTLNAPNPKVRVASTLKAAWHTPITAEDADGTPGSMDYLLLTVQDVMNEEVVNPDDAIFALMRVARKAWAYNMAHLGPIEGIPAPPTAAPLAGPAPANTPSLDHPEPGLDAKPST